MFSEHDIRHIGTEMPYLEVNEVRFHGQRFVDLTGSQLEVIRMFENVPDIAVKLAEVYPVSRVDVFVDVAGDVLDDVTAKGTRISNDGRVETIYSHHLKKRGDRPVFCRAYNAQKAGHYSEPVTRFEVEYKRQFARSLLNTAGWQANPIGTALHSIMVLLGVSIWIEDIDPIELDAPRKRYEHDRERFYRRYGKGILNDVNDLGLQGLHSFILQCVQNPPSSQGKEGNGDNG